MANNFGRVNVSVTASTGGLTAGLAAASKQVSGFSRSVSGMTGGMSSINAAAAETGILFSDVGGLLASVAVGFKNGALAAKFFSGSLKLLMVTAKAVIIPLLIIDSVMSVFRAFGDASSRLDDASKSASKFGMTASTFQTLSQVAQEAGVSTGAMTTAFTAMTRSVSNLNAGSKATVQAFERIGLAASDLRGLSPEQQFARISQAIMALPQGERLAASMQIFGRGGSQAMGLIAATASGAYAETEKLRAALGANMTDAQVKGVEMMNDSWGRLSVVTEGFWNQLVSGMAPAITTVSRLLMTFFTENTSGWSIASTLASAFSGTLRTVVGALTILYGFAQVTSALLAKMWEGYMVYVSAVVKGIGMAAGALATLTEALPGADLGVASTLRGVEMYAASVASAAWEEANAANAAASDLARQGANNIANPYAGFDTEMANVQREMAAAGAGAGQTFGEVASQGITAAVRASSQSLKALVLGSSEAESYTNRLKMGFDPREAGADGARTADATERAADTLDDIAEEFASMGVSLATISV